MLQNDTRAQRDVPGHLTLGGGSADRTVGLWWSSRKAPSWFFHGVFSHFLSFHFSSSHRPSFTYYPVVPFWQIFASNENVQAALSGGETSLSWKVILWRCFLGLCSWFLHISPHLNAGISSAASLGGKEKKNNKKPSIPRSELIQASSYVSVGKLCSLRMVNLLWNICWRLCMPPESFLNLPYWDTASLLVFFHGEGREMKEGTWAARSLS